MGIVKKIDPSDIRMIRSLYNMAIDFDHIEYKDLSFDTFLECRDNIYTYIDECCMYNSNPKIDGFIACRRTYMDSVGVDDLLFHPQPYGLIYSIEVLYTFKHDDVEKRIEVIKSLVDTMSVDKNDAFIILKFYNTDSEISCEDMLKRLIDIGFAINKNDEYTYILEKRPIVQTNRSF